MIETPDPARLATLPIAAVVAGLVACGAPPADESMAPQGRPDTLTTSEQERFAVDLDRFPEMDGGRLDTVDMVGRADGAAWHVQVLNYAPRHTAMTYAAWYMGEADEVLFAADRQPRLEDDLGNVYEGIVLPTNPRFRVEEGTTAVGVFVFRPAVAARAESLTLHVNESSFPVLEIGPFGVRHEPAERPASGLRMEPRD